jgi:MFS family permease
MGIWTAPSFGPLIVVCFFCFMSFGIVIWYFVIWLQTIRNWTILSASAAVMPLTVMGAVAAVLSAYLIPRLAAQYILAIGALSILVSLTLVATMPAEQSYWKQMFPAAIFMAFCPDFVFTAAQIIASNSVPSEQQGVAGSLIGTLLSYGSSIGLGFAGTVEIHVNHGGKDTVSGYRGGLYLGIGFAVAALIIDLIFVRMPKDEREGWDEPKSIEPESPASINLDP